MNDIVDLMKVVFQLSYGLNVTELVPTGTQSDTDVLRMFRRPS